MPKKTINVGAFKQSCLKDMEEVRRTKHPLLVTKRGKPFVMVVPVQGSLDRSEWQGAMADTGQIVGDIVNPATSIDEWAVHES